MDRARCSSLPLLFTCAGAGQSVEIEIDPVNDMGVFGNAGHDVMREIAEGDARHVSDVNLALIARRHLLDEEMEADLEREAFNCLWIWRELRAGLPSLADPVLARIWSELGAGLVGARGEVELSARIGGVTLTGHADLLAIVGRRAVAPDWKFGRVDRNYRKQVEGYSALILRTFPEVDTVYTPICWMRGREIEHYEMSRRDLPAWEAAFTASIEEWDGVYHPGDHCVFCPRAAECPAMVTQMRLNLQLLGKQDLADKLDSSLEAVPGDEVVALDQRAAAIIKLCEQVRAVVKVRVRAAGGRLSDGAGGELKFIDVENRKIDALAAWDAIERHTEPEERSQFLKVSAAKLDAVVAQKAGRGHGAAAKRALEAELLEANALMKLPGQQLRYFPGRGEQK